MDNFLCRAKYRQRIINSKSEQKNLRNKKLAADVKKEQEYKLQIIKILRGCKKRGRVGGQNGR